MCLIHLFSNDYIKYNGQMSAKWCAVLKPVGVAVGGLGAAFGVTGLGVAWLIDGSVH